MINNLTLQEIMVALTCALTIFNLINNAHAARTRKLETDPAIVKLNTSLVSMQADLTYIRMTSDTQNNSNSAAISAINQRIDSIMAQNSSIQERLGKLETAISMNKNGDH